MGSDGERAAQGRAGAAQGSREHHHQHGPFPVVGELSHSRHSFLLGIAGGGIASQIERPVFEGWGASKSCDGAETF
jgi:hypothetical protein